MDTQLRLFSGKTLQDEMLAHWEAAAARSRIRPIKHFESISIKYELAVRGVVL